MSIRLIVIQCEKLSFYTSNDSLTLSFFLSLGNNRNCTTFFLYTSSIRVVNHFSNGNRYSHEHILTHTNIHNLKGRDYGLHDDYDVNDRVCVYFDYARCKNAENEWTRFRLNAVYGVSFHGTKSLTKYCMMMTSFWNSPSHV